MDIVLGITGKDFVLLAGSKAKTRGPTTYGDNADRIYPVNSQTIMGAVGPSGDLTNFVEYILANVRLHTLRNTYEFDPAEVAQMVRHELATKLRTKYAKTVNPIVGGISKMNNNKPCLYYIDYLGAIAPVPYAAHGYAQYYCLSLLDKHHHSSVTQTEAIGLLKLCLAELDRRLPVNFKGMVVKVLSPDGIRVVDPSEYALGQPKFTSLRPSEPLVWIDCEMTGLDAEKDSILSIACVVTTADLTPLSAQPFEAVIHHSNDALEAMSEWCIEHHGKSGLTDRCRRSTTTAAEASSKLLAFIQQYVPTKGTALLAGNSVHTDKMFLMKPGWAPVIDWLHYRIFDVSSLKEAAMRWSSDDTLARAPVKTRQHEAVSDIMESINEARFYMNEVFLQTQKAAVPPTEVA